MNIGLNNQTKLKQAQRPIPLVRCSLESLFDFLRRDIMFTKQHYKAIAEIVKENSIGVPMAECHSSPQTEKLVEGQKIAGKWIALKLANYFAEDNSLFNRQKFLEACGIA